MSEFESEYTPEEIEKHYAETVYAYKPGIGNELIGNVDDAGRYITAKHREIAELEKKVDEAERRYKELSRTNARHVVRLLQVRALAERSDSLTPVEVLEVLNAPDALFEDAGASAEEYKPVEAAIPSDEPWPEG